MTRYLEFTTDTSNRHTRFSLGSPVHDGRLPLRFTELRGVRVDGAPISFVNEGLADALHKAIVDGRTLEKKGNIFDCMVLPLLMEDVELVRHAGRGEFSIKPRIIEDDVSLEDSSQCLPVAVGTVRSQVDFIYCHTVYPAHTTDGPQYVHKLGDAGPVCMSGLREACKMFRQEVTHSIAGMSVALNAATIAEWGDMQGQSET